MDTKKSRLLSIALALILPLAALADTYSSLWKQYEAARLKDHPQTMLKVLAQIADKAGRERAYGHLLKAQVAQAETSVMVSADSLHAQVERLEGYEAAAVRNGDKVLAAIYQSVLGSVYADNPQLVDGAEAQSARYYALSMSCPDELAAAFATGYEPFVVDGIDSKYYYDDMLHVIGMRAADYSGMHRYYDTHGKREAACLTAIELARRNRRAGDSHRVKKSRYVMTLDSIAREYSDLVVCGEVAIERYAYMENADDVTAEDKMNYINYALVKWGAWPRMNILRNAQRRLTLPSFHASVGGEMALPGVTRDVVVMGVNNIGELRLTASRLDIDGTTTLDPRDDKDYARLRRHIITGEQPITDVRRYVGQAPYNTLRDTLHIEGLRPGMYLVEVSADNVSVPVERALLHVCNIYPVVQAQPGNRYRFVALNATTGTAVPGAKVDVRLRQNGDGKIVERTLECDTNGEATICYGKDAPVDYRVYADGETAFPPTMLWSRFSYYSDKSDESHIKMFTDRGVYRPGQTVHVAAVAYRYDGAKLSGKAVAGQSVSITLRDANYKEVATCSAVTDVYGMASTDFVLPTGAINGIYSLHSDFGVGEDMYFDVEEYKRPTFTVELAKADGKYAAGDTVRLKASARTFAGMPVQGGKVVVRVVRRPSMFWRSASQSADWEVVLSDTLATASDGTFEVRVPVRVPESYDESPRRYYSFDVNADVTDVSGETRSAQVSVPYSDRPTMFKCDIPDKSLRDSLRTVTFAYLNSAGQPIDGDVTYFIDDHRYTCKANTPARLSASVLTSARHRLMAVCGTDTLNTSFVTFALDDRRAPVDTHDWFYQSGQRFADADTPVYIQLGSTDSIQHVVYTMLAGDSIIEQGYADLTDELRTRAIKYKEEWGDGITLAVAWVKSGRSYMHTARIERPVPDARLNVKWTTFRDRLTPGQRETWTLNVSRPDGKPAKAQLLAAMYDKSLDAIRGHSMGFDLPVLLNVPWLSWRGVNNHKVFMYSEMPMRFLDVRRLDYSRFAQFEISPLGYGDVLCESVATARLYKRVAYAKETNAEAVENDAEDAMGGALYESVVLPKAATAVADAVGNGNGGAKAANVGVALQTRENLSETAFFYPGLVTDDRGNVSVRFTLPESVTTWQFYGIAHDANMNIGSISATAVAAKTVMVQPNMPRFVRSADRGVITARISNTSDKQVGGTARMVLVDPATGREVYRSDVSYSVKAGEATVARFAFDMAKIDNDGLLVCRITASGRGYSDGEQHYLPVLPNSEMVTNTVAFAQNGPGTLNVNVDSLFAVKDAANRLTVEYTDNPAWLTILALPAMASPTGDNAVTLATAYYANTIARKIMNDTPAIRQVVGTWRREMADGRDAGTLQSSLQTNEELKQIVLAETPWLASANGEAEQKQLLAGYFDESLVAYRLADNMSRLSRLQREDGSFAWWKGMEGSPQMTMAVLQTLVRLNRLAGEQQDSRDMVAAAFAYMDRLIAREVKDMKKAESEGGAKNVRPSQIAVEYLYANTIAARKLQGAYRQNAVYLLDRLAGHNASLSIYSKAVAAVVLAGNNRRQQADDLLESICQYSVYREDMGRYFDTPKAGYSWFDYRIPTQVSAIEAVQALRPQDTVTIGQMQRWLLQSKRTQAWDTPVNSVNAVYAFLNGNSQVLVGGVAQPAVLRVNGQKLSAPKATAALGYVKVVRTGDNMRSFAAEKQSEGLSWGAVYAQFMQPVADIEGSASGMTVERTIYKDGHRLDGNNVQLAVGDRVTVRIVVNADRDYDFVQIADRRAACLEPARQLSGYAWGYYCQPKDNATNFFFDRMAKGRHVIETDYFVDRSGSYLTGTCVVQCAYAPEFMARAKAAAINVSER